MKRLGRYLLALALMMAAFRLSPGLSALWQGHVARPALTLMHRLSAALPFALLEPLALVALLLCLHRRGRATTLAVILGMYGLLWYPAYFATPAEPRPEPGDMEAVCIALIDALNASDLTFDAPYDTAGVVAGLPRAAVKPVHWPGWMRLMNIAGLFSPWTGEALVDPDAPPGYLPFTCVHELMHLRGIADEGEANVAAWQSCLEAGGMYADSARLWALRYGLGRLDAPARGRVTRRMSDRLRALTVYARPKDATPLARLLGIGASTRDYDALLGYVAENPG